MRVTLYKTIENVMKCVCECNVFHIYTEKLNSSLVHIKKHLTKFNFHLRWIIVNFT